MVELAAPATDDAVRLDLGCGQNPREGFTGVDLRGDPDVQHDLRSYPWPWDDDSVAEISCSHYVQFIPRGDGLARFMDECWRVLQDDGMLTIAHPHLRSDRAFQDPFTERQISENTWLHFAQDWREAQQLDHYGQRCDFALDQLLYTGWQGDWQHRHEGARQEAAILNWNVVGDVQVHLRARKP